MTPVSRLTRLPGRLALLAIIALLSACGGGKTTRPAPPPASTQVWPNVAPNDPQAANSVLMRAIGLVGTAVEGRIETVNGDVTVGADSRVARGIRIEKPKGNFGLNFGKHKIPRVVIGPNAVVDGPLVFEREVKLYVHASARIGSVGGATAVRYDGATPPKD